MRKKLNQETSYDESRIHQMGYVLIGTSDEYRRDVLIDVILPELGTHRTLRILNKILIREQRNSKGRADCLQRVSKLLKDIKFLEERLLDIKKDATRKKYVIVDGWVQ
jgi:hypothetical protein